MNWLKSARDHLYVETGWGYWHHLFHSIKNSWTLIVIAFKSVVHGLLPWIWKADAPLAVIRLYHQIMKIEHIRKQDTLRDIPKNERYRNKTSNTAE